MPTLLQVPDLALGAGHRADGVGADALGGGYPDVQVADQRVVINLVGVTF